MDKDEMGAIIHRMMRDLDESEHEPNRKPRCECCDAHLPLQPYKLATSEAGEEWLIFLRAVSRLRRVSSRLTAPRSFDDNSDDNVTGHSQTKWGACL